MNNSNNAAHETLQLPDIEQNDQGIVARILRNQTMQIFYILLFIVIVFSILNPESFLSSFNLRGIAINTTILAVLGVGSTFVIITAGIDLSVGSVLVCSAVTSSMVMKAMGGDGWLVSFIGIAVAIITGLAWGAVNGAMVAWMEVPPMIVTLGTFEAALGVAQILTGGVDMREVPTQLVNTVGFGSLFGIPVLVIIVAVVCVVFGIVLHRTRFGLYTYAVGSNPEAARRAGIKTKLHIFKVYCLAGSLSGLAGILNVAFYQSTTLGGHSLTNMNVIAGVVIGGTSLFGGIGTILGTVIGLFIPTTLQNGLVIMGLQSYWQLVFVGAVLVLAVYIDQKRRSVAQNKKTSIAKRLFGKEVDKDVS